MSQLAISLEKKASNNMENEIQIFKNPNFGEIRVTGTVDNPMFCLADVCAILEIGNPSQVKVRLDADGVQLVDLSTLIKNEGVSINELGNTVANFIDEPNLYRCIFRSNKKEAKMFQDWIFKDVLPTIRRTGKYSIQDNEGEESDPAVYNERNLAKVKLYEETICAMGCTYITSMKKINSITKRYRVWVKEVVG